MELRNKNICRRLFLKEKIRNRYVQFRVNRVNHLPKNNIPIFSVLIPIYDRTEVVQQAIDSIIEQSFKNFELLLICDGSPPETMAVVSSYEEHPQVRIFRFADSSGNACRGRNHGISKARGNYIAFLDSDDLATANRLERTLFHFFDKHVGLVGGAIEYLVEDGGERGFKDGQRGYTSESCTYELLLQQNMLSICTVTVQADLLLQYGGFREEMRYREDHELWLRMTRQGCTVYNSPEVYAKYRIHKDNAEMKYLVNDTDWLSKALEMHKREYLWKQ